MAFEKKTWTDRVSEYPTRRNLIKTDGTSEMVTVERSEGDISVEGDAFSAVNMNGLEDRIAAGFEDMGKLKFSYADGNYYAQYGDDESTKKLLGEIEKIRLIEALQYSGLGLTEESTPEEIYAALSNAFPAIFEVYPNSDIVWSSDISKLSYTAEASEDDSEGASGSATYYSSTPIDVTNFKTLKVNYTLSTSCTPSASWGESHGAKFRLGSNQNGYDLVNESLDSTGYLEVDVSAISGEIYLSFYLSAGTKASNTYSSTSLSVSSIELHPAGSSIVGEIIYPNDQVTWNGITGWDGITYAGASGEDGSATVTYTSAAVDVSDYDALIWTGNVAKSVSYGSATCKIYGGSESGSSNYFTQELSAGDFSVEIDVSGITGDIYLTAYAQATSTTSAHTKSTLTTSSIKLV